MTNSRSSNTTLKTHIAVDLASTSVAYTSSIRKRLNSKYLVTPFRISVKFKFPWKTAASKRKQLV